MIEIQNARIKSTFLGIEDHGILTLWLNLEYDGAGQGYGGISLDQYKNEKVSPSLLTGAFIRGILELLNVNSWEKVPGHYIRVECEKGSILRIGHIIENKWFDFKSVIEEYKNA